MPDRTDGGRTGGGESGVVSGAGYGARDTLPFGAAPSCWRPSRVRTAVTGTGIAIVARMTTHAVPISARTRPTGASGPELVLDQAPERASERAEPSAHPEGGRRILNVIVAALGLLAAVPLMLLIALAVKISSVGPIRFTQTRIGIDRRRRNSGTNTGTRRLDLGGAPFRMFKFRTMHVQSDGAQCWATAGDARITAVGRVLRQFRVDELPQLFNVLRGEMNVVGPRPEQPQIFARLRTRISRYAGRQRVRPGITGWAQVNLAYDVDEEDARRKLHYDLEYIGRQSLGEDLRILARTLPVMLGRRGAH